MIEKKTFIKDLRQGDVVRDYFVVTRAETANAKNGPYWMLELQDSTGTIEARIWSPQSREYADLKPEMLLFVEGSASLYKDRVQLIVQRLEVIPGAIAPEDMALFIKPGPVDPQLILKELLALCETELAYKPWRKLVKGFFRDDETKNRLLAAIGGKSIHHAYAGGLLEHTLSVARTCLALCSVYPHLDREILLVAAVFHDVGKAWELKGGLAMDYTDEGRLLGHIVIGLEILEPFFMKAKDIDRDLLTHLKHILVSHHGEYEYGSPRRPKTAEAFALHYADNLDAKLNTLKNAFAGISGKESPEPEAGIDGDEGSDSEPAAASYASISAWGPYQPSLSRYVYRPRKTPPSAAPEREMRRKDSSSGDGERRRKGKNTGEGWCLLPLKE